MNKNDDTVITNFDDITTLSDSNASTKSSDNTEANDETVYADETVIADNYANSFNITPEQREKAESEVPYEWNIGDVILGTYEVIPVNSDGDGYFQGGFGRVYKIYHNTWNRNLAVKTPLADAFETQRQKDNFMKECQAWIELGMHPNIVTCYFVRELGGVPRVFAEYMDGGSLKDWINTGKLYEGGHQKALARILDISIKFAYGLHYAHERGMIHQDVKPHNVMMSGDGQVKVSDFGLARAKSIENTNNLDTSKTIMATVGGMTPAYCSPEQYGKKLKLTRRTDIWSYAISVFEMFSKGTVCPIGAVAGSALDSFIEEGYSDDIVPQMPLSLGKLLSQCFELEPEKRPQNMLDIADRLKEIYKSEISEDYQFDYVQNTADKPDALNNYALSYIEIGEYDKATELFDKALNIDTLHEAALYNSCLLGMRNNDVNTLRFSRLKDAARAKNKSWKYAFFLGWIYMDNGKYDEAKKSLKIAADKSDDKQIYDAVYILENNKDKMCKVYRNEKYSFTKALFSADGKSIYTLSTNSELKQWDTHKAECLHVFTDKVWNFYLSNDNSFIVTYYKRVISILDTKTKMCIMSFSVGNEELTSLVISNDNKFIVIGSYEKKSYANTVKIWDVKIGSCIKIFDSFKQSIHSIALSEDNRYMFTEDSKSILQWDLNNGKILQEFDASVEWDGFISVHSNTLVSGSSKELKFWNIETGEIERTISVDVTYRSTLSKRHKYYISHNYNSYKLFDIDTGKHIKNYDFQMDKYGKCDIDDDKKQVLVISDKEVQLHSIEEGIHAPWYITNPVSAVSAISGQIEYNNLVKSAWEFIEKSDYKSANEIIISLNADEDYRARENTISLRNEMYKYFPITDFALCNLHDNYFTGERDKYKKERNRPRTPIEVTLDRQSVRVTSRDYSKDNKYVVTGFKDGRIMLWDTIKCECIRTYDGHSSEIANVEFVINETYILSRSYDGILKLQLVDTGECIRTLNDVEIALISYDKKYILTGNKEGVIKLWDTKTGEYIKSLIGHEDYIEHLIISYDSRYAVSYGRDYTIRIWDITKGECTRIIKRILLTANKYILDEDYTYMMITKPRSEKWNFSKKYISVLIVNIKTGKTISSHSRRLLASDGTASAISWDNVRFAWNVEVKDFTNWDDKALPFLKAFLYRHTPLINDDKYIKDSIPSWSEDDFKILMSDLSYAGLGYITEDGIRKKLNELKHNENK